MLIGSTFSAALPWIVVAAAWLAFMVAWWLLIVPWLRCEGTCRAGLGAAWRLSAAWLGWRQSLIVQGQEHIATAMAGGGVMVIANHTGAVDPLLVQAAMPRPVRWMMARDMMGSGLDDVWSMLRVIPVTRSDVDSGSVRAAMRVLKNGEVLGVFPEGRITRPPETVRPFLEGVGLLAARSSACVLPCWISGTPDIDGIAGSILGRSRSRVVFLDPVSYDRSWTASDVAADLRRRIAQASGWPVDDEPMPLVLGPSGRGNVRGPCQP
jgi:1-acyl-sn-glycerol-3-phosphate acyltransferase